MLNLRIVNAQHVSVEKKKKIGKKECGTKCFMYNASRKPSWESYYQGNFLTKHIQSQFSWSFERKNILAYRRLVLALVESPLVKYSFHPQVENQLPVSSGLQFQSRYSPPPWKTKRNFERKKFPSSCWLFFSLSYKTATLFFRCATGIYIYIYINININYNNISIYIHYNIIIL